MNTRIPRRFVSALFLAALATVSRGNLHAQTAIWTNVAGGDWNVAANWDLDFTGVNVVPAEATNASLTTVGAVIVDYNAPMAATSFGALTVDGGATLNINAAGFTQDLGGAGTAPLTLGSGIVNVGPSGGWTATNGGTLTVNLGGDLNLAGSAYFAPIAATAPLTVALGGSVDVTTGGTLTFADGAGSTILGSLSVTDGSLIFSNCQSLTLSPGGAINVTNGTVLHTNSPSGTVALGVNNNNTTTLFQMEGGTVTFDTLLDLKGRKTGFIMNSGTLNCFGGTSVHENSTDDINRLVVNGGVANLGDTTVYRNTSAGGLIVNNGVVNTTSLRVGLGASQGYATINGGALTNTGIFTVCDRSNGATSSDRRPRFLIRGGTVVSTGSAGIIVANQANAAVGGAASSLAGILDINSGLLIAEGITLVKDNTLTNAHAVLNLSGSGIIYLGGSGLTGNVGPVNSSYAVNMSGGTLAAKANLAINANITLTGTTATFQAADAGGNPFNISANGAISSSGVLNKTGAGALTLNATNTYTGFTVINGGTLALGPTAAIPNTPKITVAAGATFDASAAGGYTLASGRTLAGAGTVVGTFTAQNGATLSPGSSAGKLTFSNGLTQQGGVINALELSDDPTGTIKTNDQISVVGNLDVSAGINTILVSALDASIPTAVYRVIDYTGNLIGSEANFTVSGVSAVVSNNASLKAIFLVTSSMRGPASVTWIGNPSVNVWDALNTTNWNNAGSLDFFVPGDIVRFDNTGAPNPTVQLTEIVQPGSVTVDAAANYTFAGSGRISGVTGLTKTNSGTLVVQTANDYAGPTVLGGGVLEAGVLANGGVASGVGASAGSAANLVFDGGTLRYTGANQATDRGATLNAGGGMIDVAAGGTALTINGTLIGDGALTKAGAGVLTLNAANSYTNGTVINAGVLQINNNNSLGTVNGVTNNSATLRLNGALTLDRPLTFNGNCTVELTGVGSGNVALRAPWIGSGSVLVDFLTENSAQTFSMGGNSPDGGDMDDFSGTVNFGDSTGNARFNNNDSSLNFGSPNATFNLGTSNLILYQRNGGTTTHLGALLGGPNTRLTGRRGSAPTGTTTYSIGGTGVDCEFNGSIEDALNAAAITKVGAGKLTLSGTSTYTGATIVEAGTLQVDGALGNTAVDVGSTAVATLSGNGAIGGAVNLGYYGVLSPGTAVGQMSLASLTLQFGSTNLMEIDKANGTNDAVAGLNGVSYGGNLVIANLGGTLVEGDTFKLFDSAPGTYGGAFDTIALPALGADLYWDTSGLLVDGTIRVFKPRPAIEAFGIDGSNFFLTGTNGGNTSAYYYVLTATNAATPLASWTRIATNTFDGSGNFAFTNAVNPNESQRYYLLKTP